MCDGLSSKDLEQLGSQERIGAGPPMFQTLFPSRFVVASREKSPDGSVTLHATQTVLFNPVGVESAVRPAMFAKLKQVITLHKQSGELEGHRFRERIREHGLALFALRSDPLTNDCVGGVTNRAHRFVL